MADFDGAPAMRCVVEGDRSFSLVISPEHAPPINPSPWYAFGYESKGGSLTVTLRYLEGRHRYAPKLDAGSGWQDIAAIVADDKRSAQLVLPGGSGTVAAQELRGLRENEILLRSLVRNAGAVRFRIGQSLDGRPLEAATIGRADAPNLIVLIGRQHPPEVTGALAMDPFLKTLFAQFGASKDLQKRYRVLAVPLLNPDGVARGHWRANRGGRDLNRDWGAFTQPETRAVRDWIMAQAPAARPVISIDFHSTFSNLFYVQSAEQRVSLPHFVDRWLGSRQGALAGYPFTIEPRDANPGSGTTKNWFNATWGIPALTYEVDDKADRAATAQAAQTLAAGLVAALEAP